MTEKKIKVIFYIDKKVADSLEEASKQAGCSSRKMAKTVVEHWCKWYKDYPLDG